MLKSKRGKKSASKTLKKDALPPMQQKVMEELTMLIGRIYGSGKQPLNKDQLA